MLHICKIRAFKSSLNIKTLETVLSVLYALKTQFIKSYYNSYDSHLSL